MSSAEPLAVLRDQERLRALRRRRLLDTPVEDSFERLTRLAVEMLGTPVALVTLVDEDRQFFKSCVGLPEPWSSRRETPLTHSFCQYAVATSAPLVVEDARLDPSLSQNRAIDELGVVAYAGIPLVTGDGQPLGSFCVIDSQPRRWSDRDLEVLTTLAGVAADLIELRLADLVSGERQALLRQLVAVQEEERSRIAADVHDDPLQTLIALSVRLQLASERTRDHEVRPTLDQAVGSLSTVVERLRNLLFDLRPPALDHGSLCEALQAHLGLVLHAPTTWEVSNELGVELAGEQAVILFRIAQEAVANVAAHAHASRVQVLISGLDGGVLLTVEDDGRGFEVGQAPMAGHLGLVTMRERAELAGGSLVVDSTPGAGTTVRAWLPLAGLRVVTAAGAPPPPP